MKYTKPKEKAKKLHILTDVKVEADLSNMLWRRNYYGKEEEKAKDLERAVKDFEDFLRDHRSQDMISLSVERVFEDYLILQIHRHSMKQVVKAVHERIIIELEFHSY